MWQCWIGKYIFCFIQAKEYIEFRDLDSHCHSDSVQIYKCYKSHTKTYDRIRTNRLASEWARGQSLHTFHPTFSEFAHDYWATHQKVRKTWTKKSPLAHSPASVTKAFPLFRRTGKSDSRLALKICPPLRTLGGLNSMDGYRITDARLIISDSVIIWFIHP